MTKSGLQEFLYCVYDVNFFVFKEEKCHIHYIFDYNEYDIILNGHRTFLQKGGIWCKKALYSLGTIQCK